MANLLGKLFSAGASSLVQAVGNAIDQNTTTDEERRALDLEVAKAQQTYNVQMATLGLEEKKAGLADIASAREQQTKVQESARASWLARNVQPALAVVIIAATFAMFWFIIFSKGSAALMADDAGTKDVVIYVLGALTTVATQVVSYFFGSSAGSADKARTLDAALRNGK